MNVEVLHAFGDVLVFLEELEMKGMRYTMEKVYNSHVCETHPYKVAWVVAYETGLDIDNIPEEDFE